MSSSSSSSSLKKQYYELPEGLESGISMAYRSTALGVYGAVLRFVGMPLEKVALYMNSAQVSGQNQLAQACRLTVQDGWMAPYRVVGPASITAWFLQYSVMGFVFQMCDEALSSSLGVTRMPYGPQLMEAPQHTPHHHIHHTNNNNEAPVDPSLTAKTHFKNIMAPVLAGSIESVVANRAEVQRYYGRQSFAVMESRLTWNALRKACGPAFGANASRNCIMSATSFVYTPTLYRNWFPQESKNPTSLFWFGLGMNVFVGNTVAITQQALWGRALDHAMVTNGGVTTYRDINYRQVIQEGLKKEGVAAFYTLPKWSTRVLMNAPVQGTLPWFYNEILPIAEPALLDWVRAVYVAAGQAADLEVEAVQQSIEQIKEMDQTVMTSLTTAEDKP
jgi:hypothetical protein